jgi:hypothetical protein
MYVRAAAPVRTADSGAEVRALIVPVGTPRIPQAELYLRMRRREPIGLGVFAAANHVQIGPPIGLIGVKRPSDASHAGILLFGGDASTTRSHSQLQRQRFSSSPHSARLPGAQRFRCCPQLIPGNGRFARHRSLKHCRYRLLAIRFLVL